MSWPNLIFQSSPVLTLLRTHMHMCAQMCKHTCGHIYTLLCVYTMSCTVTHFYCPSTVWDVLCNPCSSGLTHPVKKTCLPPHIRPSNLSFLYLHGLLFSEVSHTSVLAPFFRSVRLLESLWSPEILGKTNPELIDSKAQPWGLSSPTLLSRATVPDPQRAESQGLLGRRRSAH